MSALTKTYTGIRLCIICKIDISDRGARAVACREHAKELDKLTEQRYTDYYNHKNRQKRLQAALERKIKVAGYKEYTYQELTSPTELSILAAGEASRVLKLELRCQYCGSNQPKNGFAPAFSTRPLNRKSEDISDIILLCNDCYNNWEDQPARAS